MALSTIGNNGTTQRVEDEIFRQGRDLRGSGFLHDAAAWDAVVRDGSLRANGMAAFGEQLDPQDTAAIRAYVIQQAWRGKALAEAKP